jgi:uncharacterized protein YlxP (DUF503 family)
VGRDASVAVAVVQADLLVPACRSLKEKRSVVKSLVERARHRFHASVAETAHLDQLQRSGVAAAFVGVDRRHLAAEVEAFVGFLRLHPDARLLDHRVDFLGAE